MNIAIQGDAGSFHHIAARHWYGEEHTYAYCESFAKVFEALENGSADAAIVAIENSRYGSINEVYDLLLAHNFPIVGEVAERIHQNLIGLPGSSLKHITRVYSHPVALGQCADFLQTELEHAEKIVYPDTAGAVEYIKQLNDIHTAAIASHMAAGMYELPILRENIQDEDQNYTRFLVLEPDANVPPNATKASLVLETSHAPGSLHQAVGAFAQHAINLVKLQSRPVTGKVWKYQFYLDVEAAGDILHQVLDELKNQKCRVRLLGEYPAEATTYDD